MNQSNTSNLVDVKKTDEGYRLGQTSEHKVGFFGADPIVQPESAGEETGYTANSGTDSATFTGNVGSTAYTLGDVVKHLKNLGIIAK